MKAYALFIESGFMLGTIEHEVSSDGYWVRPNGEHLKAMEDSRYPTRGLLTEVARTCVNEKVWCRTLEEQWLVTHTPRTTVTFPDGKAYVWRPMQWHGSFGMVSHEQVVLLSDMTELNDLIREARLAWLKHAEEENPSRPMTKEQMAAAGHVFAKAEDEHGDTRSGWWAPGDGDGRGFGTYLGATLASATEAIRG